jgi:adenylate cyclase
MAQQQAPQETAEQIVTFYRWVRQEVERQHGLVDRYEGDSVMATFNVSRARLDHCLLALQAAIAIRDRAAYEGLPVGAGIAVGPAVVGALTDGAEVTALGETTNLAARLQAQAAAGEVLLSEEALRRTGEWLRSQGLVAEKETLSLKGFTQPVVAYRLRASVRSSP